MHAPADGAKMRHVSLILSQSGLDLRSGRAAHIPSSAAADSAALAGTAGQAAATTRASAQMVRLAGEIDDRGCCGSPAKAVPRCRKWNKIGGKWNKSRGEWNKNRGRRNENRAFWNTPGTTAASSGNDPGTESARREAAGLPQAVRGRLQRHSAGASPRACGNWRGVGRCGIAPAARMRLQCPVRDGLPAND